MKTSMLGMFLLLSACATPQPEKKAPVVDEFTGFGALRGGDAGEKKKPKKEAEKDADSDDKADSKKGDGKGDKDDAAEEKTALTKEQVLGAIATSQRRVDACLKKFKEPAIYVMQITISPDGSAEVAPIRAPTRKEDPELWSDIAAGIDGGKSIKTPTNKCLAAALAQVKFPTFSGKAIVVTYPLPLR